MERHEQHVGDHTGNYLIARVAVSMVLNSPIAAIIVKSGNVFKQKDSTPVAIVKKWIIARPSVLFSNITPVQKKIFYHQFKITFLPWIYYNGIILLCQQAYIQLTLKIKIINRITRN